MGWRGPARLAAHTAWWSGDGLGAHVAEDGATWGDLEVDDSAGRGWAGLMRWWMGPHEMDSVGDVGLWVGNGAWGRDFWGDGLGVA